MNRQAIQDKIMEIAEEVIGVSIQENEPLKECGVDSLSLVTLIVSVEEAFSISFLDDDLQPEKLRRLVDLVAITEKYV